MATPRPRTNLPYNPRLRALARELRKNGTMGEALLWKAIQRKTLGCEFHRQVPIDEYIVDFFCPELKLAIEVDGSGHRDPEVYARDRVRQSKLEAFGIRFLRFREEDIRKDVRWATQTIAQWIEENTSPRSDIPLDSRFRGNDDPSSFANATKDKSKGNIPLDPPSKGDT